MATTVSSLVVEVGSDIRALTTGLNKADKAVGGFASGVSKQMRDLGGSVTRLGAGMSALTAPIGLAMGAGISIASEFEDSLAELSARTGITGDALLDVRDAALDFGEQTAFSAQQSIDGMLQLATSGWSVQEAIEGLPGIMDAAAAGGVELGYASDAITNVMSAFGLVDPSDANRVADALVKASGASSANFTGLTEGIANVGGVAALYGLDIEETAAALAVLTEAGQGGSEGGTIFKSLLLSLGSPEAQKAFDTLGVNLYDAEGGVRDFDTVLDELGDSLVKLPVNEQNALMGKLAGSYGIVGLSALLGAGGIDTMLGKMEGSTGAAEIAAARMNTFSGKVDALKGSVETLAIKTLTPFMTETLTPLAEKVTDIVNGVIGWTDENPELTNQLVGIAAAALVIGPGLVVAGMGISAAGVALAALGTGIAIVTSPLFLAAAGMVALGAGLAYVWTQDIGGIRTKIEDIGAAFKDADIGTAAIDFKDKITGAITDVTNTDIDTSGIKTWAQTNMDSIVGVVVGVAGIVFGGPLGMAIGAARLVSTAIETDFLGIGTFLDESGITASVETAFTSLKDNVNGILQSVFSGGGDATVYLIPAFNPDNPEYHIFKNYFRNPVTGDRGGAIKFVQKTRRLSYDQAIEFLVGWIVGREALGL